MLPHARDDRQRPIVSARAILSGFVLTFRTFLRKEGIIRALCFIMLFRLSEALLSKISPLFLIDASHNGGLGLAPQEYGIATTKGSGLSKTAEELITEKLADGTIDKLISENGLD